MNNSQSRNITSCTNIPSENMCGRVGPSRGGTVTAPPPYLHFVTRRSLGTDLDVLHTRAVPVIGGKVGRDAHLQESRLGSVWELSTIFMGFMLGGSWPTDPPPPGAYNTSQHARVIEPSYST